MDIAIFRKRFAKGSLKFLLTFIFWNWLFERCNDSWHMQQSKPCSGAGIYGRKLLKKKMKTQSWIILGRVFNNFKMMWIERVIRFKKFSCLQSYSDRHNIFHFQTTIWLTEKLLLVEHVMVLMKEHRSLDTARENFWVDYSNNYSKFILLKAICIIPQE